MKKAMNFILITLAALVIIIAVTSAYFNYLFPKSNPDKLPELADASYEDVYGSKMRYRKFGTGKPVIVLLHGFGGSLQNWNKIQPLLENHASISVDMIGFGKSDKPVMKYDLETQRRYLTELLRKLDIESVVLVGTSMGGSLASWTAAYSEPGKVLGLILLAPSGYPGSFTPNWPRNWIYQPGFVNSFSQLITRNVLFHSIFKYSLGMQASSVTSSYNQSYVSALRKITQPSFLAMSRGDTAIDYSFHKKYLDAISGMEFFEIPDNIRHTILSDYSVGTANIINQFMQKNNHFIVNQAPQK